MSKSKRILKQLLAGLLIGTVAAVSSGSTAEPVILAAEEEDVFAWMAQGRILAVTADMVDADGTVLISRTVWEKIEVTKESGAKKVVLENVAAGELSVEGGMDCVFEIRGGMIKKCTVSAASEQEMSLRDIVKYRKAGMSLEEAKENYDKDKEEHRKRESQVPVVVLGDVAQISSIELADSAKLDLKNGWVKKIVVNAAAAEGNLKFDISNFNGDIKVDQGTKDSGIFYFVSLNLVDSAIRKLEVEGGKKGSLVITGLNSAVSEAAIGSETHIVLDVATDRLDVLQTGKKENLVVLADVKEASMEGKNAVVTGMGEVRPIQFQEVSAMNVICAANGITAMEDGSLLVTDIYNKIIWQVKDGTSTIYAGGDTVPGLYGEPVGGYNDAVLKESYFLYPWAISPFLNGFAVSDARNNALRLVVGDEVQTLNGWTSEDLETGEMGVTFEYPTGLATDNDGVLYVSDTGRGAIRRISTEGEVTTVVEGLEEPMGLYWKDGILYIAETGANRIVKLVDGMLETVAGSGEDDYMDGDAMEAAFSMPQGVAVGEDGTVYVSDTGNSAIRRIKDGSVDTLLARDRKGLETVPVLPAGILVQGDSLYVCDSFARKLINLPLDGTPDLDRED